jgi:hypothetical protein
MGILAAENGMHPGSSGLQAQRFNVMRTRHKIGFRRQFIGRVAPIGICKGTQLAAVYESLKPLLNFFKVAGAAPGGIADVIGQGRRFLRVGLQCADNVHPVKGVQMVKMDDMVMLELGTHQKVAYDSRVFGNFDANGIIDCPHRGQSVGVGSDPTGALNKMMGIPGITSLQDQLDPPEHLA